MTDAPVTSVALIEGVDVDAVAAAVTACPGVSGLYGGRGDVIASYLPGRRVPGVEISQTTALITVRSRWESTAAALLDQISAALTPLLRGHRLEIIVADIGDPAQSPQAALPAPITTTPAPAAVNVMAQPTMPTSGSNSSTPVPTPTPPVTPAPTILRRPGSAPPPTATTATPAPRFPTV